MGSIKNIIPLGCGMLDYINYIWLEIQNETKEENIGSQTKFVTTGTSDLTKDVNITRVINTQYKKNNIVSVKIEKETLNEIKAKLKGNLGFLMRWKRARPIDIDYLH